MIFKNTHDAIIDEETWNNAQRLKRTVRREVKNGTYKNRLTGLLYCADCGAKLTYRSPSAQHRPDGKTYDSDNAFICGSYRDFERMLAEYDSEQSALEGRIEEITTPMLNEFIEKIVVHEADKSGGRLNRKQKVDIYFNFIGQIDL